MISLQRLDHITARPSDFEPDAAVSDDRNISLSFVDAPPLGAASDFEPYAAVSDDVPISLSFVDAPPLGAANIFESNLAVRDDLSMSLVPNVAVRDDLYRVVPLSRAKVVARRLRARLQPLRVLQKPHSVALSWVVSKSSPSPCAACRSETISSASSPTCGPWPASSSAPASADAPAPG